MRRMLGFTLIELMVTVAIVGILMAIAYPSYQDFVRRGIRSQGQQFLMDMAQRQEQYFLDQRQYAVDLGVGVGRLNIPIPEEVSKRYVVQQPFNVNNLATPPTFTLMLTPIVTGTMAADGVLIINNLQQRWRETDGNGIFGANDCRWEDTRCTPS